MLERVAAIGHERTVVFTGMGSSYDACYPVRDGARCRGHPDPARRFLGAAALPQERAGRRGPARHGEPVRGERRGGPVDRGHRAATTARRSSSRSRTERTTRSPRLAGGVLDTRTGDEVGPSTMTFAAALIVVATVVARAPRRSADATRPRRRSGAPRRRPGRSRHCSRARRSPTSSRRGSAIVAHSVILARGPARAAAEMGALTLKEAVGLPIESLQTAQFRHGPLELAGPDLAAIVIATEPETRDLDVGLAGRAGDAGSRRDRRRRGRRDPRGRDARSTSAPRTGCSRPRCPSSPRSSWRGSSRSNEAVLPARTSARRRSRHVSDGTLLRVALTFDAEHPDRPWCPPRNAEHILDALGDAGVRATFFVQGRWAESQPATGEPDRRRRPPGRTPLALPCADAAPAR